MYKTIIQGNEHCNVKQLSDILNHLVEQGYGECMVCDNETFLCGDIGATWVNPFEEEPPKDHTTIISIG